MKNYWKKNPKNNIPKRLGIAGTKTLDQNKSANRFNIFFYLASTIQTSSKAFKQFINVSKTLLKEYIPQDEELEETFNSLEFNKSLNNI